MSNMAQQQQPQQQQLEGIHKYKISPPRFNGEYNTFDEWKYKMIAYLGLQDPDYNRLLRQSEQSTGSVTNDQLENAAPSQQVAEQWIQLSNNLHDILVSTCDGPASTDKTCKATDSKHGGLHMQGTPYLLVQGALDTLQSCSNHNSMNRSSKRALQHGSSNSQGTNKTTIHYYQMQLKSQCY